MARHKATFQLAFQRYIFGSTSQNFRKNRYQSFLVQSNFACIAIKNARNEPGFYFCGVSVNDVSKETKRLKARKTTQITDIPLKILKENADIFSVYKRKYKKWQISRNLKKW